MAPSISIIPTFAAESFVEIASIIPTARIGAKFFINSLSLGTITKTVAGANGIREAPDAGERSADLLIGANNGFFEKFVSKERFPIPLPNRSPASLTDGKQKCETVFRISCQRVNHVSRNDQQI